MTITIVIPVKPFANAKTRLAGVLLASDREQLARSCFLHVLATARACAADARIEVHCACPEIRAMSGADGVREPGLPLNALLERARGDRALLVLFADLPALVPADVDRMIAMTCEHGVAIAPDRAGTGTNALGIARGIPLPFVFGADSQARFQAAAKLLNQPVVEVNSPGLANDMDTPADLELFGGLPLMNAMIGSDAVPRSKVPLVRHPDATR